MKITYGEFHDYLNNEDYAESEIKHLFNAIRSMDRESILWVIRWFCTGNLPQKEIEGVTAEFLINECKYRPLNAFIILDWLKADPQAAKYFVLKRPSTISPSDSIGQEMEELLRQEGIEPLPIDDGIDMSDIEEESV